MDFLLQLLQFDLKMRSFPLFGKDVNRPFVFLDDGIGNGKSQTGSFCASFCGEERFVDPLQ